MYKAVEADILKCIPCQVFGKEETPAKLKTMPLPDNVWKIVNMDYIGPFPNGNYIL